MVTKSDRLAERIKALTIPKEKDSLAEGLVELLPAEGNARESDCKYLR